MFEPGQRCVVQPQPHRREASTFQNMIPSAETRYPGRHGQRRLPPGWARALSFSGRVRRLRCELCCHPRLRAQRLEEVGRAR